MGCVWLESFDIDCQTSNWSRKYDNVNSVPATTTPRLPTGGLSMSSSGSTGRFRTKAFKNGAQRTFYMGFGMKPPNGQGAEYKLLTLQNNTTEQISLWAVQGSTANRIKFRIKRGSTTLGTTANEWNTTFWIYVEFGVILDTNGTDGTAEIRVNEGVELTVSGTDTTDLNSPRTADRVQYEFQNAVAGTLFDDMYVNDDQGALGNTSYMGDTSVEGKLPSADGNRNQWTPNSGTSHFNRINESTVDDDTTYLSIANNVNGSVELFVIPDVVQIVSTIYAVQITAQMRMDSSGTDKFRFIFRSGGGTEATGSDRTVSSIAGYEWHQEIYDQDPVAASAWTISNFNAMQIGVESRP